MYYKILVIKYIIDISFLLILPITFYRNMNEPQLFFTAQNSTVHLEINWSEQPFHFSISTVLDAAPLSQIQSDHL